jgi:hypothetical protein
MSSLVYTFSDLYATVSKFLGTYGSSGPSGTNLTDAKTIVNDAYSRFICGNGSYRWSFLDQDGILNTLAGQYLYPLPEGFEALTHTFQFENETGYKAPIERDLDMIRSLRSESVESRAYPEVYAIQAGLYDPKFGQRKEVAFWPTPDTTYTFLYRYRIVPNKLENDADLPIGGPEMALVLKQMCLAEAESQGDKKASIQEQKASALLAQAIARDSARKPHILGHNSDKNSQSYWHTARESWRVNEIIPDTTA